MGHRNHEWQVGEDPPKIQPHSLAKHRVFRSYLETYVSVLTKNPAQGQFRLTLVDGFAGGGRYLDERTNEEHSGSPLIMLEAMKRAAEEAQKIRNKPFDLDVQYIFIEKDLKAFKYLCDVLNKSEFSELIDDKIQLIQGEFTEQVPKIIKFVKSRGTAERVIFSLDQFGYKDVPMLTIQSILESLKNAEVILTFATDFLIDYLGDNEQSLRTMESMGLSLPSAAVSNAKDRANWTTKQKQDWRRAIQFSLHKEIPERTGAKFYTPFFIRSADSHRDYWLIHLSGHLKAKDVMVGLHWKENNSFVHYGKSGLKMLGYDPAHDAQLTQQHMLPIFRFDTAALASSREQLLQQLPEQIHNFGEAIVFNDLFSSLTNEMPVTGDIMGNVVSDLAKQGFIEVRDKDGLTIRRAGVQKGTDIIIPSRQKRLFGPG